VGEEKRLVWDLPLRLFHWLLVASVCASWATAEAGYDWMELHIWLGYWMLGLLTFRVIWGFVGPRHARFANFLESPPAVWRYAKALAGGSVPQSVGHNPLGGLMVMLILLLLAVQAGTGLFATDDIIWTGPYNPAVSGAIADSLTGIHHLNFNFILAAAGLHVAAIAFYAFVKQQNLVVPMLSGKKPVSVVPESEAIEHSQLLKAGVAILVSAAAVYWLISSAPPPPADFF
jgi:cytochrome b